MDEMILKFMKNVSDDLDCLMQQLNTNIIKNFECLDHGLIAVRRLLVAQQLLLYTADEILKNPFE